MIQMSVDQPLCITTAEGENERHFNES